MPGKYKPVPKCPAELKPIIDDANLLPRNAVQIRRKLAGLAKEVKMSPFMETWLERDTIQARFEKIIGNKELSDLLIGKGRILLNINKARLEFASLEQSKRILHYIAERNRQKREQIKLDGLGLLTEYFYLIGEIGEPSFVVPFSYDEQKGLPSVKIPPLLELIQKGDIASFDRVAVCPICECVYWLRKTTSETCGKKKCIDDLGNRKRLDKAKKLKEKNNGTL